MANYQPGREKHLRHMDALQRLETRRERAAYLQAVRNEAGPFEAGWLRDEYMKWHLANRADQAGEQA